MDKGLPHLLENFGENIRRRRKARGWTLEQLAERMGEGMDTAGLSRLERGKQGFSATTMLMAAHALDTNPATLLMEPAADYAVGAEPPPLQLSRVPVVGTAQLGDLGHWLETDHPVGHGEGYVPYYTNDPNAYAVRFKGDSMRPRIKPGEFGVIEPNTAPQPGDEVLVKVRDGRRMVKILQSRRGGQVELYSVNDQHSPISLEETEIEAIHYVAGVVKPALYFPH